MLMSCKAIAADRWLLASAVQLPELSRNFSYLMSSLWMHVPLWHSMEKPNTSSTITSFTKLGILPSARAFLSLKKERPIDHPTFFYLFWPQFHPSDPLLTGSVKPSASFLVSDRYCGVVCERGVSFSLRWAWSFICAQ